MNNQGLWKYLLLTCFLGGKAHAVSNNSNNIHHSILGDLIPQFVLALGLVLVLILAGAYLNKKLGFFKTYTNNKLKIESVLPLSNKSKLVLINFENKKYLLGLTQDSICTIDSFNATNLNQNSNQDLREQLICSEKS